MAIKIKNNFLPSQIETFDIINPNLFRITNMNSFNHKIVEILDNRFYDVFKELYLIEQLLEFIALIAFPEANECTVAKSINRYTIRKIS